MRPASTQTTASPSTCALPKRYLARAGVAVATLNEEADHKIRVHSIIWDTDGEQIDLPSETTIEADDANRIADSLSDKFGWCVESFKHEVVSAA